MAIAGPHYRCLRDLHEAGQLPQGGSILEIGEANWYGDIPVPRELAADNPYTVVKNLYFALFATWDVVSIDFHGPNALKLDLNEPISLAPGTFNVVFNHGTAEHVFNIANVLRVMHDHCVNGGLMIHESPFTGWIDHGFYTLQPTLYFDVASANGYEIVMMAVTQIELQILNAISEESTSW